MIAYRRKSFRSLAGILTGVLAFTLILALNAEDLSEDMLVQTPKWNLQPAPFTIAAAASGYTVEALDNAFRGAADPDASGFFDVMDTNSELASLAKVADLGEVKLRWEGEKPDYLLINPAFSVEGSASKRLTLSVQLHSLKPFFKLRTITVSVSEADGLEVLMKEFWRNIDVPVPVPQTTATGRMEVKKEPVVANLVAEIAGGIILDGDGNIRPMALNGLISKVGISPTQNRLSAPYQESRPDLTTARWGRGGLSVHVLTVDPSPAAPEPATPPQNPKNYILRKTIGIPSGATGLFGEGFISAYANLEDVSFVADGDNMMNYLTAAYFYKGGLSSNDRNVVFVNYDKLEGVDGKVSASAVETRSILAAYGSSLVTERKLLGDDVRLNERPSMRLDPTGKHWTYFSPAAGGLLVFKNAATVEGSFAAGQPKPPPAAGLLGGLEPACQYRPDANYRIYDHAFTPNGRALVLILEKIVSGGTSAAGSNFRKVVLWDFRGDRGVIVGDRNSDTTGLYNGGYRTTPACLELVAESSNARLFQTIRFGVTNPRHPGGLLILGCTDASYQVWKFAVASAPPADRDHGSILLKSYFTGSFPDAYKNKLVCPLAIEPGFNRILMGRTKLVEHQLLYRDRFEEAK